ncbi:MAG: Fic family protein [Ignavibacteriales bacterium]|nr:Fic family protein [Ignavibacteriales bacterium]
MSVASLPPNPKIRLDSEIYALINEADKSLYLLEGAINVLPLNHFLISSLTILESLKSLRIDDYKLNLADIFSRLIQEDQEELKNILGYLRALSLAQKLLRDVSSSSHIIKSIHKELGRDLSPEDLRPGEYRKTQTWVGQYSSGKSDAKYIPPSPGEIEPLMKDFEAYIASDLSYPFVVNAALIHAQFEMIHPFETNNGLVGRVLLQLHFLWKKRLSVPILQISQVLNNRKAEYFDRLEDLEKNNSWESWIKFFLKIIIDSSIHTSHIIKNISDLELSDYQTILDKEFVSAPLLKVFDLIFRKPFISLPFITKELGLNKQTANVLIAKLLEENILKESTGKQRYRIFVYKKLMNILDG